MLGPTSNVPLESKARSLLLRLCRRDAAARVRAADIALLADESFRNTFLDLAANHRVTGLVLAALHAHPETDAAGPDARDECEALLGRLRRRAALFGLERDRIVGALRARGVEAVLLKGAALSLDGPYADPVDRIWADIDVLVDDPAVPAALAALEVAGYANPWTPESLGGYLRFHFHVPLYHPSGLAVEVHWALIEPGHWLRIDPAEIRRAAHRIDDGRGEPALVSDRSTMFVHLLLQNAQDSFSSLGRLVDLDRLASDAPGLDWPRVVDLVRTAGASTVFAFAAQLCRHLLGTDWPSDAVATFRPSAVARFHLASMRPQSLVLRQELVNSATRRLFAELWLVPTARARFARLRSQMGSSATFRPLQRPWELTPRRGRQPLRRVSGMMVIAKLAAWHAALYIRTIAFTFAGRGNQMRFWSSHAINSDFL